MRTGKRHLAQLFDMQKHSLTLLANNTCITQSLVHVKTRFQKLYKRKAHLHHYDLEKSVFQHAMSEIDSVVQEYKTYE